MMTGDFVGTSCSNVGFRDFRERGVKTREIGDLDDGRPGRAPDTEGEESFVNEFCEGRCPPGSIVRGECTTELGPLHRRVECRQRLENT